MIDYAKALVLAPMVRISELPCRLLSLKYGADLVWGPEIIDKKLLQTKRVENKRLNTVDFCLANGLPVFRTVPALEKSKLVFQMGTADPELAVRAASVVARDVAAIDVNSGCPKHFSVHSGMGAQLLRTPDKLVSILEALVAEVGVPNGVAISVKIRILEDAESTYALVRRLVKTGIKCLTVHCRTTPMRPREAPIYDYLKGIAEICHGSGVACLVNGSVSGRDDLEHFRSTYGVDGAMIARAAEANPSCFRGGPLVPWKDLSAEVISLCQQYELPVAHAKYWLTKAIPGKSPAYQVVARAKSFDQITEALSESPSSKRENEANAESERRQRQKIEAVPVS